MIAAARRNGITSPLTPVPAIALGAEGVTPLELVAAYAPFANGGSRVKPRLVTRIEAPDGTLLWTQEMQRDGPAMDPRDAYEITRDAARRRGLRNGQGDSRHGHDRPDRRQDGHDEQRRGRLVRRLHADARRRRVVRLRHAATDRA